MNSVGPRPSTAFVCVVLDLFSFFFTPLSSSGNTAHNELVFAGVHR